MTLRLPRRRSQREATGDCRVETVAAGTKARCALPGHSERSFFLHVPRDSTRRARVLFALHPIQKSQKIQTRLLPGRLVGQPWMPRARRARGRLCRGGARLDREPVGLQDPEPGRAEAWAPVPHACEERVDDVGWFPGLLSEVAATAALDPARLFVAGFSNGAAVAHRLACEAADAVAAVAALGGPISRPRPGRVRRRGRGHCFGSTASTTRAGPSRGATGGDFESRTGDMRRWSAPWTGGPRGADVPADHGWTPCRT